MSVVDSMVIDGIALTEDKNGIVLLITDHLDWSEEYQHLMILQEKINMYLGYLEEKQVWGVCIKKRQLHMEL